jgi:hypothetical protein
MRATRRRSTARQDCDARLHRYAPSPVRDGPAAFADGILTMVGLEKCAAQLLRFIL